ncbi:MAG: AI-2E family transporter [Bacteroidales bacterium]|jgi:predicted PurR-regulated permease PerM|nr:AI-2E family transporter [Bacteroidales bacterium]
MDNSKIGRIAGIVIGVSLLFAAVYWFSYLILYVLIAFVVSMLGRPLVHFMTRKMKFSSALAAVITMVLMLGFIVGLGFLVIPPLINQAHYFGTFDFDAISEQTSQTLISLDNYFAEKGIALSSVQLKEQAIDGIMAFVHKTNFASLLNNLASTVSSFGLAFAVVMFVSFFFLKDENMFKNIIFSLIPDKYLQHGEIILSNIERLLRRYFAGLGIEVICMMIVFSVGLSIFGVKNSILFGCLSGALIVIPYLGIIMGALITIIFTVINNLSIGISPEMGWLVLKIIGVYVVGYVIDSFGMQTTIYPKTVKAHPLEIFFVIIIAGTIGGIFGMILGIPVYTIARIIAKEFFSRNKFVKNLTQKL